MTRPLAASKLIAGAALSPWRPCGIVGVGSSTMGGGYTITTKSDRWFYKLIEMLQAEFPAPSPSVTQYNESADFTLFTRPGIHGYNAGQVSTTSADYLRPEEIAKISKLNPRGIFHMVGSNDMVKDTSPSVVRTNILRVLDSFSINGLCSHIYVHQHCREGDFDYEWSKYRDVWRDIAAERPNTVGVIDVSEMFKSLGIPGADGLGIRQTDGIHLTVGGQSVLARFVRDALMAG